METNTIAQLVLFFLPLLTASPQHTTYLREADLSGPVKSVRYTTTTLNRSKEVAVDGEDVWNYGHNGLLTSIEFFNDTRRVSTLNFSYDEKGRILREVRTRTGGSVEGEITYDYDQPNRTIEIIERGRGGSIIHKATYLFDVNCTLDEPTSEALLNRGDVMHPWNKSVFSDKSGAIRFIRTAVTLSSEKKRIETWSDYDGPKHELSRETKTEYTYDGQGRLEEQSVVTPAVLNKIKYVYSPEGLLLKMVRSVMNQPDEIIATLDYTIDSRGNWIRRVQSSFGLVRTDRRTILYYE